MKPLLASILIFLGSALAFAKPVSFECAYRDIDTATESAEELSFVREAKECGGEADGACFIPIEHLKTKKTCRDLTIAAALSDTPATIDVTLWPYCGALPSKQKPRSQTISVPLNSEHFQLTTEWDGYITILKCRRAE